MDEGSEQLKADAVEELRQALGSIQAQLRIVSAQVERLAAGSAVGDGAGSDGVGGGPGASAVPGPGAPPVALPLPMAPPLPGYGGGRRAPQPVTDPAPAAGTRSGDTDSVSTWADTSGLRALGWVGGLVTVIGIVLLFVVAIHEGAIPPSGRVAIGVGVGLVLVAAGIGLHGTERRSAQAVTLAATGLAAWYLTTVGAVRVASLAPPVLGHVASLGVVAVAIIVSRRWQEPGLAAAAFTASALLAPLVEGRFGTEVLLFETVMLVGGAACLLLGLGTVVWIGAGLGAAFVMVVGILMEGIEPTGLVLVVAIVVATWIVLLVRWATGRAPVDPGPFAIRPRTTDPAQIERDYADFHAHRARQDAAVSDRRTTTGSLAVAAAVLVLALAATRSGAVADGAIGAVGLVLAALFAAVAWASHQLTGLDRLPLRVVAAGAAVALLVIAAGRLLSGDARAVAWLVIAGLMLAAVAAERLAKVLPAALVVGALAVLAAAPALSIVDLLRWPSPALVDGAGLRVRALTVVLPAGLVEIAVCAVAFWAIVRSSAPVIDTAPVSAGRPVDARRAATVAWGLVWCVAAACYGLLAVTVVLALAASPTRAGYQAGQIIATVLIALVAVALLAKGFNRVTLRAGGLGVAAIAVTKLLLFDSRTLAAMPRAVTVIGVGVLLLAGAVGYVMAMKRADRHAGDQQSRAEQ